ncbi:MAG: hypothetical protein HA496_08155 [Thaumarchaeota archaeon]|nr:hypothetical protein [Nitrososphaerota archaeon]
MARIENMPLTVLLAAMTMSIIVGNYVVSKQLPGPAPDSTVQNASKRGIAPFPGEIVTLDTVVNQLAKRGLTLYLPTKMVKGMELTAIWAEVLDGQVSFPIIVLYSNTGDTAIATAEIGIEITPMPEIPFSVRNSTNNRQVRQGGRVDGIHLSKMPVGHEEYRLKYGTEYSYCVVIKIGSLNYLFGFAPVLTEEEIIEICASMKPVKP